MEPLEVNRRGFVSGIGAAAAGAAFGAPLGRDAVAASARPFKVCVFSDIHFDDFWTNSDDTSFLDGIMARAEREKTSNCQPPFPQTTEEPKYVCRGVLKTCQNDVVETGSLVSIKMNVAVDAPTETLIIVTKYSR